MSEEKAGKNKIGARSLTEDEARLILPTYDQIYNQIEQFRREKGMQSPGAEQKGKNHDIDQKTNNIGIIGVRGAGKTSVLKTVRARLLEKHQERKDIVLPIIVPENMSESSSLMATILGMLSDQVDEREKEQKKGRNEDCIKKSELRVKCDQAIKQYTYIQKEYRDILIKEYTTENDYVIRSANVFNSDTEFIFKFNQLIEKLVKESGQEDCLLFLFIDDIDLSTYRCADVVKTLLSYLSNENIVTFISGDLETFEEALTLDFLRQEKVLDKNVLEKEIGNKTILDSKKQLAYEYLKKILPPVYRHNIKYWSLEEKANYCVIGSRENQGKPRKLSDLLKEALRDWVDPALFIYMDAGTRQPLPYTYHLFDSTSRGLNNIYNVLNDIVEKRKEEKANAERVDYTKEKRLLLDTLISSNAIYNKYRDDINKRMFRVGMDSGTGKVFFDNAYAIIYSETSPSPESKRSNEKGKNVAAEQKKGLNYVIENPEERLSLFLLVDFASRLLYEGEFAKITAENEHYVKMKMKAVEDFFFHPEVAEKVMEITCERWEEIDAKSLKEIDYEKLSAKLLNMCFLLKGDLVLNLSYYKNLPFERILKLYENNGLSKQADRNTDETELTQSIIIAFWKALSSVAEVNGTSPSEKAVEYNPVFTKEFVYIRNQLSSSVAQNLVIRLFGDLWEKVHKEKDEDSRKRQMLRRIIMNNIAQCLRGEGKNEDSIEREWQEVNYDKALKRDQQNSKNVNVDRRMNVLKGIDSGNLWKEATVEGAVDYLQNEIGRYFQDIEERLTDDENSTGEKWILNTGAAVESWEKFRDSYDGVSDTVARRTKREVKEELRERGYGFDRGMSFGVYYKITKPLEELARNSYVWYGRPESQEVLDFLQQSFAQPEGDKQWSGKGSYFAFLLQCYYKYKMAAGYGGHVFQDAALLAEIVKELSDAYKESDNRMLDAFIDQLNMQLSKTETKAINIEEFENLFSKDAKTGGQQ